MQHLGGFPGKVRFSSLLELLADPPDTPSASRLRVFRFLVLVHAAIQTWEFVIVPYQTAWLALPRIGTIVAAISLTICCALALTRYGRMAPILALPPLLFRLYWTFPWVPNHAFLVFVCVLLLATLDPDRDDEGVLLLQSLRWITIVVLFYTGFQKIVYGYWFRGEFLAWMISHGVDNWRSTFGWMVPSDEMARLTSLTYDPDSGPYRFTSLPVILLSNLTYLAEIILAVLLLCRRTRAMAAMAAIGFVILIQLAPREFMFVLCFSNLLLLFVPGNWHRRLAPLFVLIYVYLLAVSGGIVPGEFFLKPIQRI